MTASGLPSRGWYTNARLDTLIWDIDNPSTEHILPEFQRLKVGDTVPDGPEGTARFTVAAITPGGLLAMHDPATRTSPTRILVGCSSCGRSTRDHTIAAAHTRCG